ncbi:MAG: purine-binding chemotaxis protein CheW [Deltaproteobacteria bacterium]|nr:purine-binding chemotaxis protein CheW [Deltaproteobacteria bacterium]
MQESVEENEKDQSAAQKTSSKSDLMDLVNRIEGEIERRTKPENTEALEDIGAIESTVFAEKQYIKFILADISMAVLITSALEIGRMPEVTPLPNLPGWILGISNVRGEIVSIVDPKGFFGWPLQTKIREPHFIIVHNNEMKVGLLVDRIAGMVSLDEKDTDIKDEPIVKTELETKLEPYISDVSISEEKPLYVIDVDKLLSDPRMKREAANA